MPETTPLLPLNPDQLLSSTRAVRRRLDLTRPVPTDAILECAAMALQAPASSNIVTTQFLIVSNEDTRRELGRLYRDIYEEYKNSPYYASNLGGEGEKLQQTRVARSADYLADHLGDVPAIVIACSVGSDRATAVSGVCNVLPAMWSFMLAARARSFGTAWTTMLLARERETANLLGIPYETVAQAVMTPMAYTIGVEFKPARRASPETVIHWDTW